MNERIALRPRSSPSSLLGLAPAALFSSPRSVEKREWHSLANSEMMEEEQVWQANSAGSLRARSYACLLREIKVREDVMWYMKTSQLALALAIICSKPPDQSSKEYTFHLAKIVSGQDAKWASRVEILEAEVLRLRQQLILSTISAGICLENRNPAIVGETRLLTNAEECSGNFEDSGCDISNDYIADTPETLPAFNCCDRGSNNSAPVTSLSAFPILTACCASQRTSLVAHMQFLERFLELRSLVEARSVRTDLRTLGSDCITVSDSVSRLLDGLVVSYSCPELPFSGVLSQAVCVVTKLLNDTNLSSQILGQCFKKLEDSLKKLIAVVLDSSHVNRFQVQDSVSHALLLLGQCNILRNCTISLLLKEVSRFADDLQHANEVQATHAVRYENIFFLCSVLEQLLNLGTVQENAASSGCDEEERKKFLQNLDQAIFHLSNDFPLFCIYLWRLGTLLNAAQMQTSDQS
ncbi:meiosis-specific protein MEI4 [Tiliqua scincoides]|uniref:meiosis-specific protein MEI4 n=1 Tax=Tiliqua scincoides TaxID=71010 RepID=UPI003462D1E1